MATSNSKATRRAAVIVSKRQLDALHQGICDATSLIHSALSQIKEGDTLVGGEALALRTLLQEGGKRLAGLIEPLDDVIAAPAADARKAA